MIVKVGIVGQVDKSLEVEWPEGWPIPREEQLVVLADGTNLWVRSVTWFPQGSEGGEPVVYIVLGNLRARW